MTFTRILMLLCLTFYTTWTFAQTEEEPSDTTNTVKHPRIVTNRSLNDGFDITMPQFTPKAPNVAGLISAIDIPVSLYTGIPDISIPIYEIDAGEVKIPITLSYHASGIRVAQEASWVGLGWSLNVGGVVSRTIKCGDDFYEVAQPYIHEGYYTETGIETPRENGYIQRYYYDGEFFHGKNKLVKDSEPDIFYYTMPQCSGKFILKQSAGPVLLDPTSGVKISIESESNFVKYFVITTSDGTRYTFNKYERTIAVSRPGCLNYNLSTATKFDEYENRWNEQDYYNAPFDYTSSWMLTDITTVTGRHVTFSYEAESYQSPLQESVSKYHVMYNYLTSPLAGPSNNEKVYSCSKVVVNTWRLSQISWDGGYVTFPSSARQDLKGSMYNFEPNKLDAIKVYDNDNNLVKEADFTYSYFNSSYSGNYAHVFKRLKLTSLSDPSDEDNYYTFSYIDGQLPAKNSKNTDYWGYYNGIDQGADYYCPLSYIGNVYYGANKTANFEYMKIGSLSSFTHPTKGTTSFTYEAEQYTVGGSSSTNTVTYHVRDIYNVYKEYLYDTYSQYPQYICDTITLEVGTNMDIFGFADSEGPPDLSIVYDNDQYPALRISKINSNGSTTQIYTMNVPVELSSNSTCNFPQFTLGLAAGTYLIEAIAQCKDVWFAITCDYLKTETITTTTQPLTTYGGGMRVKRINGAVTKNYTYEGGKLLVDPVCGRTEFIERYEYQYDGNGEISNINRFTTDYIVQLSESTVPLSTLKDGYIFGYSKVTETIGNVSTTYHFINDAESTNGSVSLLAIPPSYSPLNGLVEKTESNGRVVKYNYEIREGPEVFGFVFDEGYDNIYDYSYSIRWPLLSCVVDTTYESSGNIVTTKTFSYDDRFQKTGESITTGNDIIRKIYVYPTAVSTGILQTMYENNMVGIPVETLLLRNGAVIDGRKTEYQSTQGMIVPYREFEMENTTTNTLYTYSNSMYPQLTYSEYNNYGKPSQVDYQGISTVYLWGYNGTLPLAEIRNATYSQVAGLLTQAFITSLAVKTVPTTSDMAAIDNLRNQLPGAQVTTYKHQPLVGITSITDARGFTTHYAYDSSNRLAETYFMKNGYKRTVNKYEYHYKE